MQTNNVKTKTREIQCRFWVTERFSKSLLASEENRNPCTSLRTWIQRGKKCFSNKLIKCCCVMISSHSMTQWKGSEIIIIKKQFLNNTTTLAIGNSQTNNHTGESKILEKTKRQDRTTRQMKRHILTIDMEVASERVTYLSAAGEGL